MSTVRKSWGKLSNEALLDVRLCDLHLSLEGTWLIPLIDRIRDELQARDLRVRPHFWLSDDWFSPSGIPGVAIPFYLAHPRLLRLERMLMHDVEGGSIASAMKLLRHEVGHAVDHAYELSDRAAWKRTFGSSSRRYPAFYQPDPLSRDYVQHLPGWYAQAHPDEDFAETFAVWLRPRSPWRAHYANWGAIHKLKFVDATMRSLAHTRPRIETRHVYEPIRENTKTLRAFYAERRARYVAKAPAHFDENLRAIFATHGPIRATTFIKRHRHTLAKSVLSQVSGSELALEIVFKRLLDRATDLSLRVTHPETRVKRDLSALLALESRQQLAKPKNVLPL